MVWWKQQKQTEWCQYFDSVTNLKRSHFSMSSQQINHNAIPQTSQTPDDWNQADWSEAAHRMLVIGAWGTELRASLPGGSYSDSLSPGHCGRFALVEKKSEGWWDFWVTAAVYRLDIKKQHGPIKHPALRLYSKLRILWIFEETLRSNCDLRWLTAATVITFREEAS